MDKDTRHTDRHRRKRQAVCLVLFFALAAAAAAFSAGIYVYSASVHSVNESRRSLECKREVLGRNGFDVDAFEKKYTITYVEIPSTAEDHVIPAHYITADGEQARDTVVMAHGLNGNRLTAYPAADMLLRNGYNVITYDQRNSGDSKAELMTLGFFESNDFGDCVDYAHKCAGEGCRVGGWGSSMGGSTIGFYLGKDEAESQLDFAVLDCPLSNMREVIPLLADRIREMPALREFCVDMGSIVTKIRLGYSYRDGNVCDYVRDTEVPVLIFNSESDRVTPCHMGKDIYNAMRNNRKKIVTVRDSGHTDIYYDQPRMYEDEMIAFIENREQDE